RHVAALGGGGIQLPEQRAYGSKRLLDQLVGCGPHRACDGRREERKGEGSVREAEPSHDYGTGFSTGDHAAATQTDRASIRTGARARAGRRGGSRRRRRGRAPARDGKRRLDRGAYSPRVGDAAAGDVVPSAVINAGPKDREPERDVHGRPEVQELRRDRCLIV